MTRNSISLGANPPQPGQTRADKRGGTIVVKGLTPGQRWSVEYPQLHGEHGVLSSVTIEQLYPVIVSGPSGPLADA